MKNTNKYYIKADSSRTNDSYSISNTPSINIRNSFLYIEESTDLPISQIADIIDIENVTHFINLLKNRKNSTPLKYKKLWN